SGYTGILNLSYHIVYDSESPYDKTTVLYDAWGGESTLAEYTGTGDLVAAHAIIAALHGTKLRFRFESDGAWSDQDGLWDTDGACILDSITVSDDTGLIDFEDFESAAVGQTDVGIWHADAGEAFGSYARLTNNLTDPDPCNENYGTVAVFWDPATWDPMQPGYAVTPYCKGSGGISAPCQDERLVSPLIDLARFSTSCDENQDAGIPPAELTGLGGLILRFTSYYDLPLSNLVFATWAVREIENDCPGEWRKRDFLYYRPSGWYFGNGGDISDLISADTMQVSLGVVDMCDAWYMVYGDCAEHTPTPWYDNVRLYRYESTGPQWYVRRLDLFQDTFPADEFDLESWCRADMANDLRANDDPVIDPGDSAVVSCSAALAGALDTLPTGEAKVYCHVNAQYIGPDPAKPDLSGSILAGSYGSYAFEDGDWTVLLCAQALTGAGNPVQDRYMIDLNDSLFTRGYMVEYYFKAYALGGGSSTYPEDAEDPYGKRLEFTCLPTLASKALYVDDYDGRGTFEGTVQTYFDGTYLRHYGLIPEIPDRYDVNDPSSGVSNGIGAYAHPSHLRQAYETIIFDAGDLGSCTISEGTAHSDKSNDAALLVDFLQNTEHKVGLWVLGDDVAYDLDGSSAAVAVELMSAICGVTLAHDSYFDLTGGISGGGVPNPVVDGVPGTLFDGLEYYAFGGCPQINRFDVLAATGPGAYCLRYPDYGSTQYYAGVFTDQINNFGYPMRTVWVGHSFMYIRDNPATGPMARGDMWWDVNTFFEGGTDWTDADATPAATAMSRCWPNPFNPVTTISFTLREKGPVSLKIYDVSGRLVRTLVEETRGAGRHEIVWDGRNDGGRGVASGIYFCRMVATEFERTEKMVLLK
ncbi:MAG: FlgD immunoglobulin-like domain containing protein, partial [Candidatus Krumholzibacteria bacterium]|nr:FlgD immunoglobulin-like domain containing protein [Candidatus Krumholzibacteria bacterium]